MIVPSIVLLGMSLKKLRKKKRVKVVSSSSSSSKSESESGSLSDAISVDSSKVSRTGRQYDRDPRFPNFTGKRVGILGILVSMM